MEPDHEPDDRVRQRRIEQQPEPSASLPAAHADQTEQRAERIGREGQEEEGRSPRRREGLVSFVDIGVGGGCDQEQELGAEAETGAEQAALQSEVRADS